MSNLTKFEHRFVDDILSSSDPTTKVFEKLHSEFPQSTKEDAISLCLRIKAFLTEKQLNPSEFYEYPDFIPIDQVYYSLEHDEEDIERVEAMRLDTVKGGYADYSDTNLGGDSKDTDSPAADDGIHSTLKNVYDLISKELENDKLKDYGDVLVKIRPKNPSQWANNSKMGQDLLYRAMEKCLTSLKNYTEHSHPFLKPVHKRDAPNYFDIIKKPMDLGTMAKKVKDSQYKSKKEFQEDLNLIWENCLTYNTLPESVYRTHAFAMKRRSIELLKSIPDISLKTRVFEDNEESESEGETEMSVKEVSKADDSQSVVTQGTTLSQMKFGEDVAMADKASDIAASEKPFENDNASESGESNILVKDGFIPEYDIQTQKWKEATRFLRVAQAKYRHEQLTLSLAVRDGIVKTAEDGKVFKESEGLFLQRTRGQLKNSDDIEENEDGAKNEEEKENGKVKKESDNSGDNTDRNILDHKDSFLPELVNFVGIPSVIEYPISYGDQILQSTDLFAHSIGEKPIVTPCMSEYMEAKPSPYSSLTVKMNQTIHNLRSIKEVHSRLALAEVNGKYDITPLDTSVNRYIPKLSDSEKPPFVVNAVSAHQLLTSICGFLLAHAGFDTAIEGALSTFTHIFEEYIINLGRTFRFYADEYGKKMGRKDILWHSLNENGLSDLNDLITYLRVNVFRINRNMHDLRRKLGYAYMHMDEDVKTDFDDFELDDYEDQFVSGTIFEDLGVDMFNVKEIGIDITSIPVDLWNKKAEKPIRARLIKRPLRKESTVLDDVNTKPQHVFIPFEAINSTKQIGLLAKYYQTKAESEDFVEDEFKEKAKTSKAKILLKTALQGRKKTAALEDSPARKKKDANALKEKKKYKTKKRMSEVFNKAPELSVVPTFSDATFDIVMKTYTPPPE